VGLTLQLTDQVAQHHHHRINETPEWGQHCSRLTALARLFPWCGTHPSAADRFGSVGAERLAALLHQRRCLSPQPGPGKLLDLQGACETGAEGSSGGADAPARLVVQDQHHWFHEPPERVHPLRLSALARLVLCEAHTRALRVDTVVLVLSGSTSCFPQYRRLSPQPEPGRPLDLQGACEAGAERTPGGADAGLRLEVAQHQLHWIRPSA
jgi:hypothetical protein